MEELEKVFTKEEIEIYKKIHNYRVKSMFHSIV